MHTRHDPRSSNAGTLFLFILLFVLMAHVSARADTLLVPEGYTLSSALAAAISGDSVSVAAGTLHGATVDLVAGVVLLSREDAANDLATINAVDLA